MFMARKVCMTVAITMVLISLFAKVSAADCLQVLPDDIKVKGLRSIELVFLERFTDALAEARHIIKTHPKHPAGYFFYAATLESWMDFEESSRKEDEFYRYCDLSIDKGKAILDRNKNDLWVQFFVGGAEGLKGNYESRYERWIAAFKYGWKGVSILKKIGDRCPGLQDVNYGIGTYDYWRSAMTQVMKWMPGVKDNRASGIAALKKAQSAGLFTAITSTAKLVDIYFNEQRYGQLKRLCDTALVQFPDNAIFLLGKAKACWGLGLTDEAEPVLLRLQRKYIEYSFNTGYNQVITSYWLCKIFQKSKNYNAGAAELNKIKSYKVNPVSRKRLDDIYDELDDLEKVFSQ